MLKKILVASAVLVVLMMFMIPSGADPTDVVLDQQVELELPGTFELIDANHDESAEELRFKLGMKTYQEGKFIVTGNLEASKNGHWVAVETTVVPFEWSPEHKSMELVFQSGSIRKQRLSGPYRVSLSLKAGSWELPMQVVGFSPKYNWRSFSSEDKDVDGEITNVSNAKRAVETWAQYKNIKLGKLIGVNYNYDRWQLDYKERFGKIIRFLVSPKGSVELLKINKNFRGDKQFNLNSMKETAE